MDAKTQKVLRDHDRDVTTALESVSSLITDAYRNPDPTDQSPWNGRPDQDVLQVAQIGAAQAIAISIRSLTAHLGVIGLAPDTGTTVEDATLQVPQSLIDDAMVERAARALFEDPSADGDWTWDDLLREDGPERAKLWRDHARAILVAALLRPTPGTEPRLTPEQRRQRMCPCTTEPVVPDPVRSVRHLAEGSTFWAKQHGDRQLRFWFLAAGSGITSLDGILAHADSIDASTIRDVTPPPATPANTGARRSTEETS